MIQVGENLKKSSGHFELIHMAYFCILNTFLNFNFFNVLTPKIKNKTINFEKIMRKLEKIILE